MTILPCAKCHPRMCECRELEWVTPEQVECDWCLELFPADQDMAQWDCHHMCPKCAESMEVPNG